MRTVVVAPGFIDMLGQSEMTMLVDPHLPSKIYQGITTEITGEGGSVAPLNDAILNADHAGLRALQHHARLAHLRQYFARLEKQGMGINLASYVGATQVRRMVLGDDDKQPTPAQLDRMRQLVGRRWAGRGRRFDLASDAPAPYAKTEELIALATEAAKFGGIYATHMRNERVAVLPAIDEACGSGARPTSRSRSGTSRSAGKANWGRCRRSWRRSNAARASRYGRRCRYVRLPRMVQRFSAFIPPWAHDGGKAKLIERLKDPAMRARIRKDMQTPSADWDNEWQEIPRSGVDLDRRGPKPQATPVTRQDVWRKWRRSRYDHVLRTFVQFLFPAAFSPASTCWSRPVCASTPFSKLMRSATCCPTPCMKARRPTTLKSLRCCSAFRRRREPDW